MLLLRPLLLPYLLQILAIFNTTTVARKKKKTERKKRRYTNTHTQTHRKEREEINKRLPLHKMGSHLIERTLNREQASKTQKEKLEEKEHNNIEISLYFHFSMKQYSNLCDENRFRQMENTRNLFELITYVFTHFFTSD